MRNLNGLEDGRATPSSILKTTLRSLSVVAQREIRISVDEWAQGEEVTAVEEAARAAGLEVRVEASFGVRSVGTPSWHVVIELAGAGIGYLLAGFVGRWGEEANERFRAFMKQLFKAREKAFANSGAVTIIDPKGNWIVIGDELPDEAYDKLFEESWEDLEGGYLLWDETRREWIDHTGSRREG
jgi:hypothetical protein